jgi:hypothetical protein
LSDTVSRQPEPTNFELNHPILALPGIQKKLQELNKSERALVNLLFQREGEEFTREGLALLLGNSSADSMRKVIDFKKLRSMKLISESKGKTKADLSLMGLTKK